MITYHHMTLDTNQYQCLFLDSLEPQVLVLGYHSSWIFPIVSMDLGTMPRFAKSPNFHLKAYIMKFQLELSYPKILTHVG